MTRRITLLLVLCIGALTTSGCGDASAGDSVGGKCAALCERADGCPNVVAEPDCVETCEEAVQAAASLGGTCPGAMDETIACQTQLSCGELLARALGGFHDDACVATDRAASSCTPGDRVDPTEGAPTGSTDELLLACQALCQTGDDCPNLVSDFDCVEGCYAGFSAFEDGTAECNDALINAVNCQAALSCSDLGHRVSGRAAVDGCVESDRTAERLCL